MPFLFVSISVWFWEKAMAIRSWMLLGSREGSLRPTRSKGY